MSQQTLAAIAREIIRHRNEIAFLRGDVAIGGPDHAREIRDHQHVIATLEFERSMLDGKVTDE